MIVPSLFHAPPRGSGTAEVSVCTDPPSMSIRFSLVPAKNPMDRLSGDQNGADAAFGPCQTAAPTANRATAATTEIGPRTAR